MELKEFSHKGEAIEKEIKKEFQFMGRTIKKRRVGLIIAAAGVIAVIVVAIFIRLQKFDVWDYITISYEGANGYASPDFTLNKDKLYKELMGKSTDSDKSYNVKMLIASIEITTEAEDVSNGDKYKVTIDFDKKYEDAVGISMGSGSRKIKAAGIQKGTAISLFDNVDVMFAGISPEATVNISNNWENEYLSGLTFTADKTTGIKFGDTVNVTCNATYEDIARHGYLAEKLEQSYDADKLPSFATNVSQVDSKVIEQVKKEVLETIASETSVNTFHMLYKATKDVSFLYHVNNETCMDSKVTGVYFLSGNGQQTDANNYIYVFASAVISDSEDSRTVYFAFSYSNTYLNVDGTFDMNHDNENKRYICSDNYEALYEECVGSRSSSYSINEIK